MSYLTFEKVNISGADEHPTVNGEYTIYQIDNGFPSYQKVMENETVFIYTDENSWFISTKFMDTDEYYYTNTDYGTHCPEGGKSYRH